MRDLPMILAGLAVFLALATLPFWYRSSGRPALAPPLAATMAAQQCVAPADVMRRSHMEMLNAWRDRRVRDGVRTQAGTDGRIFEISLTHTCLEQCHGNRAQFCDQCHTYVGLKGPECWNCHAERSAR